MVSVLYTLLDIQFFFYTGAGLITFELIISKCLGSI